MPEASVVNNVVNVDQQELVENGFVIVRGAVPADQLARMRASCEQMLQRQKEIWRRERGPHDPPCGEWELAKQPRVHMPSVVDESTAHVIDFCLGPSTMGVSQQLLGAPIACPGMLAMLCSPPIGMGRTRWHRDITPPSLAPLCGLQQDFLDNGPALVQWNVALYDDDVLWVVPGSHRRRNTEAENAQWYFDAWAPLPDSVPVELKAGDGVAYSNMILHWGSNYTAQLRRTLHLSYRCFGSDAFPYYAGYNWELEFTRLLSSGTRAQFERFQRCFVDEYEVIGDLYRAIIDADETTFRDKLQRLHPGPRSRLTTLALLSKVAKCLPRFYDDDATAESRQQASGSFYVKLMQPMFERFTAREADCLWERFNGLDAKLQSPDTDQFEPMMHVTDTRYYFYDMPQDFDVDDFVASWN